MKSRAPGCSQLKKHEESVLDSKSLVVLQMGLFQEAAVIASCDKNSSLLNSGHLRSGRNYNIFAQPGHVGSFLSDRFAEGGR